jgi:hypothetical protein
MLKNVAVFLTAAIIAAGLCGCTRQNPFEMDSRLESNWGRSFEAARTQQILNPAAEKNLSPVEGLDGPAAEQALKRRLGGDGPPPAASAGPGSAVGK